MAGLAFRAERGVQGTDHRHGRDRREQAAAKLK
jgi:hypothetical protein